MRVTYVIHFRAAVRIDDHWPFDVMGGTCRVLTEGDNAIGLEIVFTNQSVELSPELQPSAHPKIKFNINERDTLLPEVERTLRRTLAFLQCHFSSVAFAFEDIETSYEPETDEERDQIQMYGFKMSRRPHTSVVSFDFWTRAFRAAEQGAAPEFEAVSVHIGRRALVEERYIDSFRYSFLLIEAFYGDGKFHAAALKDALRGNLELRGCVEYVLKEPLQLKRKHNSPTEVLLAGKPSIDAVLDHLVEQRGLYFHGNIKRPNAWRPEEQEAAEALALLAHEIAMGIAHIGAGPMFDEKIAQAHYDTAVKAGAIMSLRLEYNFRDVDDVAPRTSILNMNLPGAKLTPRLALFAAQRGLEHFENSFPLASLNRVACKVRDTSTPVFDLRIHVDAPPDSDAATKPPTPEPPKPAPPSPRLSFLQRLRRASHHFLQTLSGHP